MLLIYYNPNLNNFYLKIVRSFITDKRVGDVNQFNHQIVQILYIDIEKNKLINCNDFLDYYYKDKKIDDSPKNKLINALIRLLYRLKK